MTRYLDGAPAVGSVRGVVQYLSEDNVIGANASIIDFVRQADNFACRLLMSRSQISGLVHLSDLQKLPVRAAIFALITDLEIAMSDCIEFLFRDTRWESLLSNNQLRSIDSRRKKASATRVELGRLIYTLFSDKALILSQSELLVRSTFRTDFDEITSLRIYLMHANEFAETRDAAIRVCKVVRTIEYWTTQLRERSGGN